MATTITIVDVARLAEVSTSTVSNLLNGRDERMRPATRDRILNAIDELGYKPNVAARQLKTGQSSAIGLIVPSVANPFYGIFAQHVEQAALQRGYQVLLGNSQRDTDREKAYAEELWGYGVRGMIFGSSLVDFTHLFDLVERGMNVVAFDRPAQASDRLAIDSIGVDNVQAARVVTKHLLALGHRRIGFLSGPIRSVSRLDRLQGYRDVLTEAGIAPDERLIWQGTFSNSYGDARAVDRGRQGAQELLSIADPPTALFAVNDMYAFGAYAGARDLGLRIPSDISIVGFDDIALADVVEPPLTTIRQPVEGIAQAAVERLVGRLEGAFEAKPNHQTLPAQLILRGSTARPTSR